MTFLQIPHEHAQGFVSLSVISLTRNQQIILPDQNPQNVLRRS
jgi:hypothetical protein